MHNNLGITFLIFQKLPSVRRLTNCPVGLIFMTGFSIIRTSAKARRFAKMGRSGKAYTRRLIVPVSLFLYSFAITLNRTLRYC